MSMQTVALKTIFLGLTFVAITAFSQLLTACKNSQSQAPSTAAMNHGNMQGMNHEVGMDHSMTMNLGPADANYDLRFIDAMSLHHQGAVKMAQVAEQKSQHLEIKQLAGEIVDAQNQEIERLAQWRKAWYPQASNEPIAYGDEGTIMAMPEQQQQGMTMFQELGAADAKFDLRFINAMIPHHEGALTMAEDALSKSQRSEVRQLAQAISTSQQAEIEQMKQWRQAWYQQ